MNPQRNRNQVAIFGGGIAGMSAAHELMQRGFAVTVYEKSGTFGGKARSLPFRGSGKGGRKDLPAEHGFRFFPAFYRHITDTMRRIPFPDRPNGVANNLVSCSMQMMTHMGSAPVMVLSAFPRSWREVQEAVDMPRDFARMGITLGDIRFFTGRMWQFLTSCEARRLDEYGRVGWWQFVKAEQRSKAYQTFFAKGATRTLVANQAELADTLTTAKITAQLLFAMADPSVRYDRLLNGPTNDVWLEPWFRYLLRRGVRWVKHAAAERIHVKRGRIDKVTIRRGGKSVDVRADHYLFAVPVEVMGRLVDDSVVRADPVLDGIRKLQTHVEWMNGIQYYLREDVPMVYGHQMYLDSPWALTAVSQAQFWPDFDWAKHGDGEVRGCLSVCVSDWTTPGFEDGPSRGKPARVCNEAQVVKEVWEQLKRGANAGGGPSGRPLLEDENLHSWVLDPDIVDRTKSSRRLVNREPLLVNRVGTWDLRPDAYTAIPNLFLASDYVRTHTSLATMEAANEAARRAVNAILLACDSIEPLCEVWPLEEPAWLKPLKWWDERRYEQGRPWDAVPFVPHGWLDRARDVVERWIGE